MAAEPLRVLILEDNPAQARLVDAWLEMAKPCLLSFVYPERRIAHSLAEAGEVIRNYPIDAAIVDLGLPDADGLQVVEALAQACPDMPVVVLTGNEDLGRAAIAAGAEGYLVKGDPEALSLRVRVPHAIGEAVLRRRRHTVKRETLDAMHELAAGPWFTARQPPNGFAQPYYALAVSLYIGRLLLLAAL